MTQDRIFQHLAQENLLKLSAISSMNNKDILTQFIQKFLALNLAQKIEAKTTKEINNMQSSKNTRGHFRRYKVDNHHHDLRKQSHHQFPMRQCISTKSCEIWQIPSTCLWEDAALTRDLPNSHYRISVEF